MRIGVSLAAAQSGSGSKKADAAERRFNMGNYAAVQTCSNDAWMGSGGNRMQQFEAETASGNRSEAARIYEAVTTGGKNPLENIRQTSKMPLL